MGIGSSNKNIKLIWFDENINSDENIKYFKKLKNLYDSKKCKSLDEGFENFYGKAQNIEFRIIIVIISGRLFGRYIKKLKENINKIVNIPYTYIFTSNKLKKILLRETLDKDHELSYDTMIAVNDGFYNPGGIYDDFETLLEDIKLKMKKIESNINITPRIKNKLNYEGLLTFEYLESEEDLLAPALYKDIITNEKITLEHCKNFHNFILSFNIRELNNLIKDLDLFKYIPFEILSKYWARCYTIESDFYKLLNNQLMKSQLPFNFKTYIKMCYTGVEINSFKSYSGKYLYRGSVINKIEIEKIIDYKNKGKLSNVIVFSKTFLSFSEDKNEALKFCEETNDSKIGILYIIENNNNNLHESNANIQNFSVFPNEKEILFFPGSSFIIKDIKNMNNNQIEITLNYNGKFKEKYSLIFEDQEKINNLIYNNIFTKNVAGEKLTFLKKGKYLVKEKIGLRQLGIAFKGKDLETDEFVAIKQIPLNKENKLELLENCINEVKSLKKLLNIENSKRFRDSFQTNDYYYIISDLYEDNLFKFFKKNYLDLNKTVPPNLIKKVFNNLNVAFKELLNNNLIHGDIKLPNILMKYTNKDKTNFDSFLSGFSLSREFKSSKKMVGTPGYMAPEIFKGEGSKINSDLFSIGMCICTLYFGKFPYKDDYNNYEILNFEIEEDKQLEDLLKKLIKINPDERITWEEYFKHPFFKQYEY